MTKLETKAYDAGRVDGHVAGLAAGKAEVWMKANKKVAHIRRLMADYLINARDKAFNAGYAKGYAVSKDMTHNSLLAIRTNAYNEGLSDGRLQANLQNEAALDHLRARVLELVNVNTKLNHEKRDEYEKGYTDGKKVEKGLAADETAKLVTALVTALARPQS